jgi:tetratricopeptide (TPR) repeat protein
MKRNCLSVAIGLWCLLTFTGCGKSPDSLYSSAKELAMNTETVDEGLKKLILFEEKFSDDPRTPDVLLTIANLYQSKQDFEKAAETYKRLIEKYRGTPEEYKGSFLLGYMYYDVMNDPDSASRIFRAFIDAYPDSELTVSAKVLLENINQPIDQWEIIKQLNGAATDTTIGNKPSKP